MVLPFCHADAKLVSGKFDVDFSSSAQFFCFIGVMSFLCLLVLIPAYVFLGSIFAKNSFPTKIVSSNFLFHDIDFSDAAKNSKNMDYLYNSKFWFCSLKSYHCTISLKHSCENEKVRKLKTGILIKYHGPFLPAMKKKLPSFYHCLLLLDKYSLLLPLQWVMFISSHCFLLVLLGSCHIIQQVRINLKRKEKKLQILTLIFHCLPACCTNEMKGYMTYVYWS